MKNPIQKAAEDWQAKAIQDCHDEVRSKELGLCPECMCKPPCICDRYAALEEMRTYYEANRRTLTRAEPTATRSWGIPVDVLMEHLFKIATRRHDEVFRKK
jgi:hypothetical protein